MNEHKNNVYKDMRIAPLTMCQNCNIVRAMSDLDYGLFVWDYKANICYVNQYIIERFSIDITTVTLLQDYLATQIDDNSLFRFLKRVYEIRHNNEIEQIEFPVKSRASLNWYKLELKYNEPEDVTIGIIKIIEEKEYRLYETNHTEDLFEHILSEVELPISVINDQFEVIFSNIENTSKSKTIYEDIEKWMHDENSIEQSEIVEDIQVLERTNSRTKLLVRYVHRNSIREEQIVRRVITHRDKNLCLFTHYEAINSTTEQIRLRKIIRANELMMETKDIVDHIDDLNDMFNYLLSKIQTVIPEVSRCCILRLNPKNELYLDSSYGFKDEYIEEFALPFKKSFAYIHMQNDFTKSVVINDIQLRYSELFPDVKGDDTRFNIASNITTPLVVNNNLYGLISVDSDQNRVFDDVDMNLLDYIKVQTERAIAKYQTIRTIKKDSTLDSLTGISNRRHLLEVIETFKTKANTQNRSFKFVIFDIDQLKAINDTYGHNCGDQVIKQFAFIISSNVRDTDFIARVGGDEFVGLFYNMNEETLQNRLDAWQQLFKNNPVMYKDNLVPINFSYGISEFPTNGTFFSELMESADEKMYTQKRRKKESK